MNMSIQMSCWLLLVTQIQVCTVIMKALKLRLDQFCQFPHCWLAFKIPGMLPVLKRGDALILTINLPDWEKMASKSVRILGKYLLGKYLLTLHLPIPSRTLIMTSNDEENSVTCHIKVIAANSYKGSILS